MHKFGKKNKKHDLAFYTLDKSTTTVTAIGIVRGPSGPSGPSIKGPFCCEVHPSRALRDRKIEKKRKNE